MLLKREWKTAFDRVMKSFPSSNLNGKEGDGASKNQQVQRSGSGLNSETLCISDCTHKVPLGSKVMIEIKVSVDSFPASSILNLEIVLLYIKLGVIIIHTSKVIQKINPCQCPYFIVFMIGCLKIMSFCYHYKTLWYKLASFKGLFTAVLCKNNYKSFMQHVLNAGNFFQLQLNQMKPYLMF